MAQSVTIAHQSESDARSVRVGGVVVSSNWSTNGLMYEVPASKRLVLKTRNDLRAMSSGTGNRFNWGTNAGYLNYEITVVLGPGCQIYAPSSGSILATGFLEDDI